MHDADFKTASEPGEEWIGLDRYLQSVMLGLQAAPHIYAGSVPAEVVAKRRAKNRAARHARRGNTAALRRQARSNRVANGRRLFRRGFAPDPLGTVDGRIIDAEVVE